MKPAQVFAVLLSTVFCFGRCTRKQPEVGYALYPDLDSVLFVAMFRGTACLYTMVSIQDGARPAGRPGVHFVRTSAADDRPAGPQALQSLRSRLKVLFLHPPKRVRAAQKICCTSLGCCQCRGVVDQEEVLLPSWQDLGAGQHPPKSLLSRHHPRYNASAICIEFALSTILGSLCS